MKHGIAQKVVVAIICVVLLIAGLFFGIVVHDHIVGNDLIVEETTYTVEVVSEHVESVSVEELLAQHGIIVE